MLLCPRLRGPRRTSSFSPTSKPRPSLPERSRLNLEGNERRVVRNRWPRGHAHRSWRGRGRTPSGAQLHERRPPARRTVARPDGGLVRARGGRTRRGAFSKASTRRRLGRARGEGPGTGRGLLAAGRGTRGRSGPSAGEADRIAAAEDRRPPTPARCPALHRPATRRVEASDRRAAGGDPDPAGAARGSGTSRRSAPRVAPVGALRHVILRLS